MRLQRRRLANIDYVVRLDEDGQVNHAATSLEAALSGPRVPRELLARLNGDLHQLLAPVQPTKIIAVGLNYRGHAAEMGKELPPEPLLFSKPPSAVIASGEQIVLPRDSENVHFEGELAAVIGRRVSNISQDEATEAILGYTLVNDVTARDIQHREQRYTRAKGYDTFAPIGPTLVAGLEPSRLNIETRVNGEVRQRSSVSDLIFSVPELVSFISSIMTLMPGDVILTGTPAGVGRLEPGDLVEVEVAEIGVLANRVVAAG